MTDAKVRKDVKDAMLRRGNDVFAGATGLKGLSDFLAASKADAKTLAQVLNGIAKSRSGGAHRAPARRAARPGLDGSRRR